MDNQSSNPTYYMKYFLLSKGTSFFSFFVLCYPGDFVMFCVDIMNEEKLLIAMPPKINVLSLNENEKHNNRSIQTVFLTISWVQKGFVELHRWISRLLSVAVCCQGNWNYLHYVASYYKASFSQGHYWNVSHLHRRQSVIPVAVSYTRSHLTIDIHSWW